MIKRIYLLPLLLLLICGFQTKTGNDIIPKIKKTINLKTGNSTEYFYNQKGMVDSTISTSGIKIIYSYRPDMILKTQYDSKSIAATTDTLMLNKKGLTENLISYQNGIRFYTRNEYDETNHLIRVLVIGTMQMKRDQLIEANSYTFNSGNRTKVIFWDENKKPLQVQTETYLTDKKNTIANENVGMDFMGKSSINLLKQNDRVNSEADSFSVFYSYRFDDKERVKLKASYNKKGTLIDSMSYIYY